MKNIKTLFIIIVSLAILWLFDTLHGCSLISFRESNISFHDLPKEMKDTILYWKENQGSFFTNIDSLIQNGDGMPLVISFDEKYSLENEKFGPWVKSRILTRVSDGKTFKFPRYPTVPFIIRNDTLVIPTDYNILLLWDSTLKWHLHKLR